MYIAVCDDNARELRQVGEALKQFASERNLPIRFRLFDNAESMLKAAADERFTHYLLDIMMPCMDGITAAREIRSFDAGAKIVFLTSFQEYAYQSYRVKAYDYLLKPVRQRQLFGLLDEMQLQEEREEACICIHNGRSVYRIPLARLAYLEVYQKKLHFYLTDGQVYQLSGTMAQVEKELLAHPEFAKIHRSYIVNLGQISVFSAEGCILFSGKSLPISRLLYQQVRRQYMMHLFGDKGV